MKMLLLLTILSLQALSTPAFSARSPLTAIESGLFSRQHCNLVAASNDVTQEDQGNNNEGQGDAAEEEEPDCD